MNQRSTQSEAPRFTAADFDALSVPDDIEVRLVDDVPDVPDGACAPRSELPHWSGRGGLNEGAAIALWQMFAPAPDVEVKLPRWLDKQGISFFRGWIRPAGPVGPDYVLDWAIPLKDGTYVMHRDGDVGPYSPPPGCVLQTFLDAAIGLSRQLLLVDIERLLRFAGRLPGDPDTVYQERFPRPGA